MILSELTVIALINKGIDCFYNLFKTDKKYERRILYYHHEYVRYNRKYDNLKIQLQSAIANKDDKTVKKLTKNLQIIYNKLNFIKTRIAYYEKLSNNCNNNSK